MAINLKALQPHKVSRDLSGYITYIYGPAGAGKAQPVDTLIPTPSGFKRMGDIKPGDEVFTYKGTTSKVLAVFPQGVIDNYKVTLSDGRTTYCNDEHIWACYDPAGDLVNYTVKEMLAHGLSTYRENKKSRYYYYKVPVAKAVQYPKQHLYVDPYLLGNFLANGNVASVAYTIYSKTDDIPNIIREILGADSMEPSYSDNLWRFNRRNPGLNQPTKFYNSEVFFKYPELIVSRPQRRIPEEYLVSSETQRYSLLQGICDAVAYPTNSTLRIPTESVELARQIVSVLNSLGYVATINTEMEILVKDVGLCYENFFRSKERLAEIGATIKTKKQQVKQLGIVDIEKMDTPTEMVCLYINDYDHVYLTNDYIPTHNTTLGSQMPKPLLLSFEKGYNAIAGVITQDITTWAEMKQVLRQLDDPEVKDLFRTIVVDTTDIAAQLCEKYVCNQLGIENIGDGGWATNGWAKVKREWEQTFRNIAMKGYAVLFISHSKDKTFKRKDGTEYNQIVPTCSTAYNEIIKNMSDIMGYIDLDGNNRTLILRSPDGTIDCKSRFAYMAPSIPFSYESLVNALQEAIEKEGQRTSGQLITNEREQIAEAVTYDYDATMAEFGTVVTNLMKANQQYYGPRITEIVEKYLGKGKKASEATRAQVEQLYLIVDEIKHDLVNGGANH